MDPYETNELKKISEKMMDAQPPEARAAHARLGQALEPIVYVAKVAAQMKGRKTGFQAVGEMMASVAGALALNSDELFTMSDEVVSAYWAAVKRVDTALSKGKL